MGWNVGDVPSQAGRLAIVTGANAGLGFETALALAGVGAEVVVAARDPAKGDDAVRRIMAVHRDAKVGFQRLDLASLASVETFAEGIVAKGRPLDLLVNNAGVMALPARQTTADGFEMQLGVNYLGHYALTGRLLPMLRAAPAPRVVSLSSGAHHMGAIRFDDLQAERGYDPWRAYSQSKLAMLMFAIELQRRSDAASWGLLSVAAHPGYARTELIANGPGHGGLAGVGMRLLQPFISQSAAEGALPTLFAATSPDAKPGGYYGPSHRMEMVGPPNAARMAAPARDEAAAARLWEVSAALTHVSFG